LFSYYPAKYSPLLLWAVRSAKRAGTRTKTRRFPDDDQQILVKTTLNLFVCLGVS
jgi:hypothetical protein